MACFVAQVDTALAEKMEEDLTTQGFTISHPPYTHFSAKKKGVSCTLYQSGKMTVQGRNKDDFIAFYIEPEILKEFRHTHQEAYCNKSPRIGIDEAGKGDFFGPLCIGGVYADASGIEKLLSMGVRDSKTMSDTVIVKLSVKIKAACLTSIIRIYPQKYNQLYATFNNLNSLLGWGHATAIEELAEKSGCQNVIIDQFASEHVVENALKKKNLDLSLTQRHRGEEDLVVAAASIIARAAFLEGMDLLSKETGHKLPKGASSHVIDAGRYLVAKHGEEILGKVAKLHFKTKGDILRA